jgi:hypothetical protein
LVLDADLSTAIPGGVDKRRSRSSRKGFEDADAGMWEFGAGRGGGFTRAHGLITDSIDVRRWMARHRQYRRKLARGQTKADRAVFKTGYRGHERTSYQPREDAVVRDGYIGPSIRR